MSVNRSEVRSNRIPETVDREEHMRVESNPSQHKVRALPLKGAQATAS